MVDVIICGGTKKNMIFIINGLMKKRENLQSGCALIYKMTGGIKRKTDWRIDVPTAVKDNDKYTWNILRNVSIKEDNRTLDELYYSVIKEGFKAREEFLIMAIKALKQVYYI